MESPAGFSDSPICYPRSYLLGRDILHRFQLALWDGASAEDVIAIGKEGRAAGFSQREVRVLRLFAQQPVDNKLD